MTTQDYIERAVEVMRRGDRATGGDMLERRDGVIDVAMADGLHSGGLPEEVRPIEVDPEKLVKSRVLVDHRCPALTAYKVLRTRLLRRMVQNGWTTLGITSPREGEGKTLTTINLAISISMMRSEPVVLVDLDFHKPAVHRYFGFDVGQGVAGYLSGEQSDEVLAVKPGIEQLVIYPGSCRPERSSELLSSLRMGEFVSGLKGRYPRSLVLFDLPPMLIGDDVLAFSPYIDTVLLVVEENSTTTDDLKKVAKQIRDLNMIGCVLNKASSFADDGYEYGSYK